MRKEARAQDYSTWQLRVKYSERTNRKQPCFRSERQKEKNAHAQDNKLSCGKLSYLYKLIGNEKTRLMKVTYLLSYLVT